jgi:hypothetical protein
MILTQFLNRPRLIVDIVTSEYKYFLRCRNVGNVLALDISLDFDNTFINSIKIPAVQQAFRNITLSDRFALEPNGERRFELFWEPTLGAILMWGNDSNKTLPLNGTDVKESEWKDNLLWFKQQRFVVRTKYSGHSEDFHIATSNAIDGYDNNKLIWQQIMCVSNQLVMLREDIKNLNLNGNK